jgi:hypothetical protein
VRLHADHEQILTELAGGHATTAHQEQRLTAPTELRALMHEYINVTNEEFKKISRLASG